MTQPKGRCEFSADVSRDGMDQKPEDGKPQIGTLNVHEEIDADSTESADSTTQVCSFLSFSNFFRLKLGLTSLNYVQCCGSMLWFNVVVQCCGSMLLFN